MNSTPQCPYHIPLDKLEISRDAYKKILCPNLRVGVRMGHLTPNEDGWVSTKQLKDYLIFLGLKDNSKLLRFLLNQGELITSSSGDGKINLSGFVDSGLDHGSSSGILNNEEGFSEVRLDVLKSYAVEDKLYKKQFAIAANQFHTNGVTKKSKKGALIQALELSSLLDVYGRTDQAGEKYLTVKDIDDLWKESKFPEDWIPPEDSYYGNLRAAWNLVSTSIRAVVKL